MSAQPTWGSRCRRCSTGSSGRGRRRSAAGSKTAAWSRGRSRTRPGWGSWWNARCGNWPPNARRLDPQPQERVRRVWNIPARNLGFTGRDGLLAAVRERLLAGDKAVVQAFQGMGGVGKTQLAIEYAHRFADSYDLAWWVNAEQGGLIGDQFAALGHGTWMRAGRGGDRGGAGGGAGRAGPAGPVAAGVRQRRDSRRHQALAAAAGAGTC